MLGGLPPARSLRSGGGKSKVRYKTMRGYKSPEGTINAIALTQWLYNGEYEHDLAQEMAP